MKKKLRIFTLLSFLSILILVLIFIKDLFTVNYYENENKISKSISDKILIVTIDDLSNLEFGPFPFKRSIYAAAISRILIGKPRVIGIDVIFSEIKDWQDDIKLIDVLGTSSAAIVLAIEPNETENHILNIARESGVKYSFANIYYGNANIFIEPKNEELKSMFAVPYIDKLGHQYLPFPFILIEKFLNVRYEQTYDSDNKMILRMGNAQVPIVIEDDLIPKMLIQYSGELNSFEKISFKELFEVDTSIFLDKLVLIGVTINTTTDFFKTSLTPHMPGVVVNANIIHSLLNE